jgi:hypothetical protein
MWVKPPDSLDVEFDEVEVSDLGGCRVVSDPRRA